MVKVDLASGIMFGPPFKSKFAEPKRITLQSLRLYIRLLIVKVTPDATLNVEPTSWVSSSYIDQLEFRVYTLPPRE